MDGRYSPGFRLVLSTLAEENDVSTVPVREAVRWLEAEGLVEFKHNAGAMVSRIDVSTYADSMETLAYLEGAATAAGAPFVTEEALAEAEDLNRQMSALNDAEIFDHHAWRDLNAQFHTLLWDPCPNVRLKDLLRTEAEQVQRIRRSSFQLSSSRSVKSVEQHACLIQLVRDKADSAKIEDLARAHKMSSLHRSLENIDEKRN